MTVLRVQKAIKLIDDINIKDPVSDISNGKAQPKEWLYGLRMSECLAQFEPDAGIALQIAARAQHIKRWSITRDSYPLGKAGYFDWRQSLGRLHAQLAMEIAQQVACDEADIDAIGRMLRKEKIKRDPQVQTLEDVICLVFLQFYFTDFCKKHDEDKLIRIVQKTWAKMSEKGHQAALKLPFTDEQHTLLGKALA